MLGHFQTLLEAIAINLDQTLAYLPILTATERHQLVEFNQNQSYIQYPSNIQQCIHQLFESHSSQTPEAIAVVDQHEQLTYQQLNCRSNKIAHYLQKLGVAPEVKVGIYLVRSPDAIVSILGILKAGGAYVPLDPLYPLERLKFMLEDAQISVLLTQEQNIDQQANEPLNLIQNLKSKIRLVKFGGTQTDTATPLPEGAHKGAHGGGGGFAQNVKVVCLDRDREIISQQSQSNPTSKVTSTNIAYIIYTSGSTGQPKGVLVEHHGLCNLVQAQMETFELKPKNRILQFASLSFDASIFEIVMALGVGASLYMIPEQARLGAALVSYLQNHQIYPCYPSTCRTEYFTTEQIADSGSADFCWRGFLCARRGSLGEYKALIQCLWIDRNYSLVYCCPVER